MSVTEFLTTLFTSFDFWRFYLCAFVIIVVIHTAINLLLDIVMENPRSIHIFLFATLVCPVSLIVSAYYFNPFGETKGAMMGDKKTAAIVATQDAKKAPENKDAQAGQSPAFDIVMPNGEKTSSQAIPSQTSQTQSASQAKPQPHVNNEAKDEVKVDDAELLKEFRESMGKE